MIYALHARDPYRNWRPVCNADIAVPAFAMEPEEVTCRRCLNILAVPADPRDALINAVVKWDAGEIDDMDLHVAAHEYRRLING